LTLAPTEVTPDDAAAVRAAGVSAAALHDAVYVAFLFNMIDRVADALGWNVPGDFSLAATVLLRIGYR
jgi:hypothetical protein